MPQSEGSTHAAWGKGEKKGGEKGGGGGKNGVWVGGCHGGVGSTRKYCATIMRCTCMCVCRFCRGLHHADEKLPRFPSNKQKEEREREMV